MGVVVLHGGDQLVADDVHVRPFGCGGVSGRLLTADRPDSTGTAPTHRALDPVAPRLSVGRS